MWIVRCVCVHGTVHGGLMVSCGLIESVIARLMRKPEVIMVIAERVL